MRNWGLTYSSIQVRDNDGLSRGRRKWKIKERFWWENKQGLGIKWRRYPEWFLPLVPGWLDEPGATLNSFVSVEKELIYLVPDRLKGVWDVHQWICQALAGEMVPTAVQVGEGTWAASTCKKQTAPVEPRQEIGRRPRAQCPCFLVHRGHSKGKVTTSLLMVVSVRDHCLVL